MQNYYIRCACVRGWFWIMSMSRYSFVVLLLSLLAAASSGLELEVSISTEGQPIAGEEYALVCSVSSAGVESVNSGLTVEWLAPSGSAVEQNENGSYTNITQLLTYTLAFNPLLPSHGGQYRCRATLLQGGQELLGEHTVNVNVSVPPPEVMTTYLKVPAGYVLRCFVLLIEDTPLLVSGLTMEWLDPHGNSLKTRSGVSIAIEDGRRRVGIAHKPQMTSDAGVYTCQVTLELSGNMFIASQQPVTRVSQTVFVAIPTPNVTIAAPSGPLNIGDSLTLQCQVETSDAVNTPLSYAWKKSGEVVYSVIANDSYTINITSISTKGSYSCEVSVTPNEFVLSDGVGMDTVHVIVQIPTPTVTILSPTGPLYFGETLTLQCQVEISDVVDTPVDVNYTWKKYGEAVSSGVADSSVTIEFPVSAGGNYSCEVFLTPSQSTEFTEPSGVGMDTTDVVVQDWAPRVNLTNVVGRVLDVSPYNSFSLTCSSTSPVQGLASVFIWSEKSLFGDLVELMGNETVAITMSSDDSSELSVTTSVAGEHIILCNVSVELPDGSIKTNSTQVSVSVQGPVPPIEPVDVRTIVKASRTALVGWTMPLFTYTPETYIVEFGEQSGFLRRKTSLLYSGGDITLVNRKYATTLQDLKPYTTYHCRVESTNSFSSAYSNEVNFTTTESAPEGPPLNLMVIASGSRALQLSWECPEEDKQNGEITGYIVECNSRNSSTVLDTRGNITSVTVENLAPFTMYICSVSASNIAGSGPKANITGTTAGEAPSVVGISIIVTSACAVNITWENSLELHVNGIIYYLLRLTSGSADGVEYISMQVNTASLKVEKLSPGVPYLVSIVAATSAGKGEPNEKIFFTEERVPSVSPSEVNVERLSSTAMNVSWALLTLEEARGFVSSYTVSYRKGEGRRRAAMMEELIIVSGGEQSSVVIGGLDPGSSYLVSVSASTREGRGEMSEPVVLAEDEDGDEYTASSTGASTSTTDVVEASHACTCSTEETVCQQEYGAVFGHGFAAGMVSGVLILSGLAGLVAALMFFLRVVKRRQKIGNSHLGEVSVEMSECTTNEVTQSTDQSSKRHTYDQITDDIQPA